VERLIIGKDFWNVSASTLSSDRTKARKFILDPKLFEVLGDVKGKKILEIGCGVGNTTLHLARLGAICTGIDYAEKAIEIAKANAAKANTKIDYRVMDVRDMHELKKGFDIVVCVVLFPHLPKYEHISKTLAQAYGLLKPEGRFVLAEPHPTFDFYMRERLQKMDFKYPKSGQIYDFVMEIGENSLKSRAYHWTLGDYYTAIVKSGFIVKNLYEPMPSEKLKKLDPRWYAEKTRYPPYMILDCAKYGNAIRRSSH
jgi:2-polyprenyl-3-methyl-5-hydroxy-6-metoxy-1,4-benzoquinol methylase